MQRVKSFRPKHKSDREIISLLNQIYEVTKTYICLPPRDKFTFKLSNRLVRKTGNFRYALYGDGRYKMEIVLSRKLLIDREGDAQNLLSSTNHEFLHMGNFHEYILGISPLCYHDGPFLRDLVLLNSVYKDVKPITITHNIPVPHKYILKCTDCGAVLRKLLHRGRLTKSKTHDECGGLLQYEKIIGKSK